MARKNRRKARELAFQVLYGLCFTPAADEEALRRAFELSPYREAAGEAAAQEEANNDFAWELARGVWQNTAALDEIVNRHSRRWKAERMGRIELTLLRLALFELYWQKEAPAKAVVNETVELARHFGAADAGPLLYGILEAAAKNRPGA